MTEIESILKAFDKATEAGKKVALATVVHVDGSSYRRPGARMLITEDGEFTGSISGGCLEGDALHKALLAIHSSKTMLVTYDTTDEDDAKFGMGLGCNGIIQVLIEPLPGPNEFRVIDLLRKAYESRQKAGLVTLYSLKDKRGPQPGSCFLLNENGEYSGEIPFSQKELVMKEAMDVIKKQKSSFKKYQVNSQEIIAFTEIILPAVSLVIIGGGNDVIPLVKMADILGWQTTVADGRPMYANKERFPVPSCQVLFSKAEDVLQNITVDNRTVFVLMSHNYNYDLSILRALLERQIVYIGILGPKKKLTMMIEELEDDGIILTPQQRDVIHGPVGLNIGAETAEEIAISIVAEIKSVLSSTRPESLRNREDTIHLRSDLTIENSK
ncbi:MAG: XdhC family protein [Bacteroidetes bacterium]|nr:MAG: XdhC family protein [Bacteroidota bacterium]